jgi:hypothetical protein
MAKRIPEERPDWLQAPDVVDVYSVSACVNESLALDIPNSLHNGYWMFDSPAAILVATKSEKIDIRGAALFFYEAHESELDGDNWLPISPDASYETHVQIPSTKHLEGFDVVTFCDGPNSHSPLSCNGIAKEIRTNQHCLFQTIDEALAALTKGAFDEAEPGPYRIYAIYSVPWPE